MDGLIPNFTLFIQVGIFLTAYLVLNTLVFKPYVNLLELRRAKTDGLREKAEQATQKAEKLQRDYEDLMTSERKKVALFLEEEKKKIGVQEREIIQEARTAASKELGVLRAQIGEERTKAQQTLLTDVPTLASQITSKILGYPVNIKGPEKQIKRKEPVADTISG